jgi:hypothetical protein
MCRRWYSWPLFVLQNLYGIALIAALTFAGLSAAISSLFGPSRDLPRAALGLLMGTAPALVWWWYYRRQSRKATGALAALNPIKLRFTAEGFHTTERSGATSFVPWSIFAGYRKGKTIFLLRDATSRQYRVIPTEGLSSDRVGQIRSAIHSCLPELG